VGSPLALPGWVEQEAPLIAAALVLSLALNWRWLRWPLYPLQLLATWAHECAHGVAALLVGGRVERLQIFADGSGLATTRVPATRLRAAWVASAGYPGTALLGAGLLAVRHLGAPGQVLAGLGGFVVLSALLWVRNVFGFLALGGLGGGLVAAGVYLPLAQARLALALVGAAVGLNALTSLGHLFGRQGLVGGQPRPSDARLVAAALWLPSWIWASLWLLLSLGLLGLWVALPALV
jgi:hypothetical protein